MQCRNCGAEIADKAIICYRCGTATTDPVRKGVPLKPRRLPMLPLVSMVLLLLLALYLGQASRTASTPDYLQLAAGLAVGAAVVVLVLRIARRRR
jgi:hypothetical protein